MKQFFLLLCFCIFAYSFSAWSQEHPSLPLDSILRQNPIADTVIMKADTVASKLDSIANQKDSVIQKLERPLDSLVQRVEQKRDSITSIIESKADSIQQKLTSDNEVVDHAEKIKQKAQTKVQAIQEAANTDILPEKLESNPITIIPQSNVLTDQARELKENASQWIEKVEPVKKADAYLDQVKQLKDKVSDYSNRIQALPKDKLNQVKQLPTSLEQKAMEATGLQELQAQNSQLEAFKQQSTAHYEQLKQYQDQVLLKEQAQAKLLEKAKNHFAGHADKLQEAQQKVEKFKRKYTGEQTEDGKLIKQSSLQGKPLSERLVWGGQMQILPGPPVSLDLSPMLGYQINKLWMIGAGGTYRASLQPEKKYIVRSGEIYGIRALTEHQIIKGFFMHGEYELMNTEVKGMPQDSYRRGWVEGVLVGAGKTYHISEKVKGSIMILYNLMHQEQSPYPSPWMVRFGFNMGKN